MKFYHYKILCLTVLAMLVDESVQTSRKMERKAFEERVIREGMDLWKKQREFELRRKLQEQREIRQMMDTYWPWGKGTDARPRGLRNLRLEELFPNKDYLNNKRYVGSIGFTNKAGGGGAPIFSDGKKITRTCEDPMLRFQFGSKDLRKCVDNTLRYKTNKQQQEEYKKELDKLVEEKKQKEKQEKKESVHFHQEQGWSDEKTLKHLENEAIKSNTHDNKKFNGSNKHISPHITHSKPSTRLDPIAYPKRNFIPVGRNRKLSPLSENKDEGVELVALLAKDRKYPLKIPLCSSDITSEKKMGSNFSFKLVCTSSGSSFSSQSSNVDDPDADPQYVNADDVSSTFTEVFNKNVDTEVPENVTINKPKSRKKKACPH
ncbi:unnamed protein product [Diabrotica balteata]|uniref:Uncharacterized protein n=1 Tax=Diabrotica balteata TaxID=107213 RepID=A0A9N9T5Q6_DIABA|nr:unnamed protein product [Diabrotica balteata]